MSLPERPLSYQSGVIGINEARSGFSDSLYTFFFTFVFFGLYHSLSRYGTVRTTVIEKEDQ